MICYHLTNFPENRNSDQIGSSFRKFSSKLCELLSKKVPIKGNYSNTAIDVIETEVESGILA